MLLRPSSSLWAPFVGVLSQSLFTNDILVASPKEPVHKLRLSQLFEYLKEHSLVINVAKCQFGPSFIGFLGHQITLNSARPLPDKVKAVTTFKEPVNISFYVRFIQSADQIMLPPFSALLGIARGSNPLVQVDDMLNAFQEAKETLAETAMLTHPHMDAPMHCINNKCF